MSKNVKRPKIPRGAKVGRFPVMALLQAARYYLLYGDLEKAKSFGLNRAIFYAWAKYYGPGAGWPFYRTGRGSVPAKVKEALTKLREEKPDLFKSCQGRKQPIVVEDEDGKKWAILFDGYEAVPVGKNGWFEMGGQEQKPRDFDRQVAKSFEAVGIPFEIAWKAALEYLKRFPIEVLKSPSRFYKYVYEPVRDDFVDLVIRPYVEGEGKSDENARKELATKKASENREAKSKQASKTSIPRFRTLDEFLKRK